LIGRTRAAEDSRRNRSLHALVLGTGLGVVALVHGCRAWDDVTSVSRYYMSFEMALVFAVLLKTLTRVDGDDPPPRPRSFIAAALVILAVGIQIWDTKDELAAQYRGWLAEIASQIGVPAPKTVDAQDAFYQRVQQTIPAGAPFMEILDQPFRLDFRRNRIFICDQPGGASPKPGFPIYKGVEDYERYLRGQSIRYLAFTLGPASVEYSFPPWRARAASRPPAHRDGHTRGTLLREMGVIYVDFFKALTELTKRHKQLFDDGQVHVLDLDAAPDGTPIKH